MMKPFVIRKQGCGHYSIFKLTDISDISISYDFVVTEVAHLETFSDVLVLLNCGVMVNGEY